MYKFRAKDERGKSETYWLDSSHTFSFANYYDPYNMGFGDLRVINDDYIRPEGGFSLHPHDNMEIISIVLEGALEHKDSMGNTQVLYPGDVQVMTAGSGIYHSEYNHSSTDSVHFLQIWLLSKQKNLTPSYEQKSFEKNKMLNEFKLIVSENGQDDSLIINQDAFLYRTFIEENGGILNRELKKDRKYWIQTASGTIEANKQILTSGDGLGIADEEGFIEIKGVDKESDVLFFDLAK